MHHLLYNDEWSITDKSELNRGKNMKSILIKLRK